MLLSTCKEPAVINQIGCVLGLVIYAWEMVLTAAVRRLHLLRGIMDKEWQNLCFEGQFSTLKAPIKKTSVSHYLKHNPTKMANISMFLLKMLQ